MRSLTINTSNGPINFKSLQDFIRAIPIHHLSSDYDTVQYDITEPGYTVTIDPSDLFGGYTEPTTRHRVALVPNSPSSKVNLSNYLHDILEHAQICTYEKSSLVEMLHEIVIQSMCYMGRPDMAVRLGNRLWMVANPRDFRYYYNGSKAKIVCLRPDRHFVYKVKI